MPCQFLAFETLGQLADAAVDDVWDICTIAHEPERAGLIDFSQPYVLSDAHFLVRANSLFTSNEDIDQTNVKIATFYCSAYDLWLRDNLHHASLLAADSIEQSHDLFLRGEADVLASLKPRLQMELAASRHCMITPHFTTIKQAVGSKKTDPAVLQSLNDLIAAAIKDGFIEASLAVHGVDDKLTLPEPSA